MTVSFTKEEVGWLLACLDVATSDLDEEFDYDKECLDAAKRIKEKLRMVRIKR